MRLEPLPIPGAFRIRLEPIEDERGSFARTFDDATFAAAGLVTRYEQGSLSVTRRRGTVRGLHYQREPWLETKIVRCVRGAIYDVILDLRPGAGRGKWYAEELSAENRLAFYLPAGTAHGFQTLADDTELSYQITPPYVAEASAGVRWNDPDLGIPWPIPDITVGERDKSLPFLKDIA
jgi:dTDP-4-dehydrorhamnose 3,5-epimerase